MSFFNNFKNSNLIIAHRGFCQINIENSLKAFKNSIDKSDLLEFDIQFTKDYVPVITHDETLERLSNVKDLKKYENLKPWYVKDFLYSQIKELSFDGEKITSLEEFLNFAKLNKIYFNLEIKDINEFHNKEKCIDIILGLLDKYSCKEQVLISAFNHEYLKLINQKAKTIALAALDEKIKREDVVNYLKSLNIQAYNIDETLINKNLIKALNDEKIEVFVFTVNKKKKIDKLFELGVKGVFTDKPYEESKTR